MSNKPLNFDKGVRLVPTDDAQTIEGQLSVTSTTPKLKARVDGSEREVITADQTQILTNKTFDADLNSLSNVDNGNIKAGAAIDASKIADGSVSSAEFQYLSNVTSDIQTQIDSKASSASLTAHTGASSGVHGVVGSVVGTSDSQVLTNKTFDADLNTLSNVDNADIKVGAAIDASKLADGSVSNAEFQYLANVTSDIQTQLNNKASSTDLTTHTGASSGVHGVTGSVVGTSDTQSLTNKSLVDASTAVVDSVDSSKQIKFDAGGTASTSTTIAASQTANRVITLPDATTTLVGTATQQVLTNKDYDGGTASDNSRITVPSNTKTNLDALTRKEATIVYGTDTDKLYVDNGTTLVQVGSGTGSLDTFYSNDFETDNSSIFSTGNNATFLGGGTVQGTLANETTSPISGARSIKFTQAAGSLNDYIAFPAFTTTLKQKGQQVAVRFPYKYDGSSGDIKFVAYDVTNSLVLTSSLDVLESASSVKFFQTSFGVPSGCNSLRFGFQVAVANNTKILIFDDIELSTNSSLYDLDERSDFENFTPTGSWSSNTTYTGKKRRVGDSLEMMITISLSGAPNSTALTITLPDSRTIDTNKINTADLTKNNFGYAYLRDDSATATRTGAVVTYNSSTSITLVAQGAGQVDQATPFTFATGDVIVLRAIVPISNWSSSSSNIVTPVKSPKQYDLTVTGTGWTTSRAIGMPYLTGDGKWRLKFNIAGAVSSSSRTNYSISITGVTFKNTSSYSQSLAATNSALTSTHAYATLNTGTIAFDHASATTTSYQVSGDVELESQPTFADPVTAQYLAAVPTQQIAYLKDSKASGTAGGTFTSGSYQTRTLNTVEGDQWFLTLSSNQFTLLAGKYSIEASAPAYKVINHKCKVRNTTDSSDTIIGSVEVSDSADNTVTRSVLSGVVEISSTKTFELQHRCNTTRSTDGFGVAATFGDAEIYSFVKITKLK